MKEIPLGKALDKPRKNGPYHATYWKEYAMADLQTKAEDFSLLNIGKWKYQNKNKNTCYRWTVPMSEEHLEGL